MSITSRQRITANDDFKHRADTWLWKSILVAALQVADRMRFSPALYRDRPVYVIVSIPLRFEAH